MAVYVYVIDTQNLKPKQIEQVKKKFGGTISGDKILVKIENLDNSLEYLVKKKRVLKVGLADIEHQRVDMLYAPSSVFSEKFDEMMRKVHE